MKLLHKKDLSNKDNEIKQLTGIEKDKKNYNNKKVALNFNENVHLKEKNIGHREKK